MAELDEKMIGLFLLFVGLYFLTYTSTNHITEKQLLILSNQDTIKAEQEAQRQDIILIFEELAVIGQDSVNSTE